MANIILDEIIDQGPSVKFSDIGNYAGGGWVGGGGKQLRATSFRIARNVLCLWSMWPCKLVNPGAGTVYTWTFYIGYGRSNNAHNAQEYDSWGFLW